MRKARLIAQAMSGRPNTFLTLTVNPKWGHNRDERARALADAWRKIVRAAKRRYGYKRIPYLCVFERTKRGEPHLHILCRVKWLDQEWLSEQMDRHMSAPIVDIRRVTNRSQIAGYVMKYIGKDPQRFGSCKRYWQTKDWEVEPYEREVDGRFWSKTWEIRSITLSQLAEMWHHMGWLLWYEGETLHGGTDPPLGVEYVDWRSVR